MRQESFWPVSFGVVATGGPSNWNDFSARAICQHFSCRKSSFWGNVGLGFASIVPLIRSFVQPIRRWFRCFEEARSLPDLNRIFSFLVEPEVRANKMNTIRSRNALSGFVGAGLGA